MEFPNPTPSCGLEPNMGATSAQGPPVVSQTPGSTKPAVKRIRPNRGLRHFSVKVCEKLADTQVTTYNQIANLLVQDFMDELLADGEEQVLTTVDEKNIRRRIYDALNVLMAMGIIQKRKKQIVWKGLRNAQEQDCFDLRDAHDDTVQRITKKRKNLQDVATQFVALKSLIDRNAQKAPAPNPTAEQPVPNAESSASSTDDRVTIPFVVVGCAANTEVDAKITPDREEVFMHYHRPFIIHDHYDVLQSLGDMVPKRSFQDYIPQEMVQCLFGQASDDRDTFMNDTNTENLAGPAHVSPTLSGSSSDGDPQAAGPAVSSPPPIPQPSSSSGGVLPRPSVVACIFPDGRGGAVRSKAEMSSEFDSLKTFDAASKLPQAYSIAGTTRLDSSQSYSRSTSLTSAAEIGNTSHH